MYAYPEIVFHIFALTIIIVTTMNIVPVTHPEERGISQVYAIQHNANDGEDRSDNVHQHRKAHLRRETPLFFSTC